MKETIAQNALPDVKADGATLRSYFESILPNYDAERVYTSDIVKLIKWYKILENHQLLPIIKKVESEEKAEEIIPEKEEVIEAKPAKKTKKAEKVEEAEVEVKPKKKSSKKKEEE
jgi:hypothetical protein